MLRSAFRIDRAPASPSSASFSIRLRRTPTSANSAATKNALRRTRTRTPATRKETDATVASRSNTSPPGALPVQDIAEREVDAACLLLHFARAHSHWDG